MINKTSFSSKHDSEAYSRRKALKRIGMTAVAIISTSLLLINSASASDEVTQTGDTIMKHKAYIYTELQISVPFKDVPWQAINGRIKAQPGFINKTWLAGTTNNSAGGFYVFDSIENAQKFVTNYFPDEAKGFSVAQTTRIFDAVATEEASRDMNSMHIDGKINQKPGAFVYTEVQVHASPFNEAAPWRQLNPTLKKQPGLLGKTWLSGLHTATPGGLYAFDTVENAQKFAIEYFPTEAQKLNAAFYTRVFDANVTEAASRDMNSPFYK